MSAQDREQQAYSQGTWSGSAEVPCRPAPPAALSEAPYVDGERSFWSTGPGRRICTREDVAALRTEGLPAFPFPQGELLLFFSSDVILDGTEIIIVFNQEILNTNSISIFQVIRCALQIILLFLLFPFSSLLVQEGASVSAAARPRGPSFLLSEGALSRSQSSFPIYIP